MKRRLRRAFRWVLLAALAMVLAYEELQWRLSAVFAILGRLPVLRQIEAWVRRLPPYGALALFALPSLFLLPLKLLALRWLAMGHAKLALSSLVFAKIAGTALVGRIFQLTRPALLTIGWCKWIYDKVMELREAAYSIWRSLPVVRWWKMRWARYKAEHGVEKSYLHRQWMALREWSK